MSVVIAIKEGDHIVMGCDRQVSFSWTKELVPSKIFAIKNCPHGLMGVVGLARGLQVLQAQKDLVDELKRLKGEIDFDYCVTNLYEKIYSVFLQYRLVEKKDGEYVNHLDCDFLFAYKDKCWLIFNSGFVMGLINDDFLAIGSGAETAEAVLRKNVGKPAEERIREAIKICSETQLYVDNNVVLMTTETENGEMPIRNATD